MGEAEKPEFKLPKEFGFIKCVAADLAAFLVALRAIFSETARLPLAIAALILAATVAFYVWRAKRPASVFVPGGAPSPRFGLLAKVFAALLVCVAVVPFGLYFASRAAPDLPASQPLTLQANSPTNVRGSVNYNNSPGVVNGSVVYGSDSSISEELKTTNEMVKMGHSAQARGRLVDKANGLKVSIDSGEEPLARKKEKYVRFCNLISQLDQFSGDLNNAELWLSRALNVLPDDPASLLDLATVYASRGQYADATRLCERIAASPDANNAQKDGAASFIGIIELDRGHLDEAEKILKKALARCLAENYMDGICGCFLNLGKIAELRLKYDEALDYYGNALQFAHTSLSDPGRMAKCYVNIGTVYKRTGDLQQAEKNFRLGVLVAKTDSRGYELAIARWNLSEVLLANGNLLEARANADESLKWYRDNHVADGQSALVTILRKIDAAEKQ
jgi:tetratricopeptide (TPR) repeat protein